MPRRLLSDLEKQARRRISWITAANAGKVVTRDIYWTVPFLELYLDRCDDLSDENPADGLTLALHAPNLARLIGVGGRPGEYISLEQKTSYEVIALAVLGSLYRRVGQLAAAERNYAHAFDIVKREQVKATAHGELLRRYGYLRACLTTDDALEYLNRAVEVCRQAGPSDFLADALNTRGHCYANRAQWRKAARDFSRVLQVADQKSKKGKRTASAAIVNLAFVVASGSLDFEDQTRALECLRQLRDSIPRLTPVKCRCFWMEGLIHRNLLLSRPAVRYLSKARKGMLRLGEANNFVLVSLDLAHVYWVEGDLRKYERLQLDTATAFESIAGSGEERAELLSALERWRKLPIAEHAVQSIKTQVEATLQRAHQKKAVPAP